MDLKMKETITKNTCDRVRLPAWRAKLLQQFFGFKDIMMLYSEEKQKYIKIMENDKEVCDQMNRYFVMHTTCSCLIEYIQANKPKNETEIRKRIEIQERGEKEAKMAWEKLEVLIENKLGIDLLLFQHE